MLAISVSMSCLFAYLSLTDGAYKQWWLNLIETAFISNLLISSIECSCHFCQTHHHALVGTTFALLVAIIFCHIVAKVLSTKRGWMFNVRTTKYHHLLYKLHRKSKQSVQIKSEGIGMDLTTGHDAEPKDKVTYSTTGKATT